MKRISITFALMLAAGFVWWRIAAQPARVLSDLMPEGALLYLDSPDFSRLIQEWNASGVKRDWLASTNYDVFTRSNLFGKLGGVYQEYGTAAGFTPDLNSVIEIAGDQSALALYDIHDVQFLYITHVPQNRLASSQLWRVRDKFEERRAADIPFYVRTESNRTVAFAFTNDYLLLATRDDLMAQALALVSGGKGPSISNSRWFQHATKAGSNSGELRMALNMEGLLKSSYFRSHWIYRNASKLEPFESGIAVVSRDPKQITENRVFIREPDEKPELPDDDARRALAALISMAPDDVGLYKAWAAPDADFVASTIERKLLVAQTAPVINLRYAPGAVNTDTSVGAESDLETRIDEPPLPAGSSGSLDMSKLHQVLDAAHPLALLQLQSSFAKSGAFVSTPCVLAIEAETDWDASALTGSLTTAIETLWTTSGLGAQWVPGTAGAHAIERLDGLKPLMMLARGRVLFLSNDADLLAAVLDRRAAPGAASTFTYVAALRHSRERGPYQRLMNALDSGQPEPRFFSQNIGSLSDVLSFVDDVNVTLADRGDELVKQITYRLRQ